MQTGRRGLVGKFPGKSSTWRAFHAVCDGGRRCGGWRGLLAGVLLAGLLGGCRAPAPPVGPTAVALHVESYQEFYDRTLSLLRRYDFPPDRVDFYRGLIVSEPTTSAQWFEFWRVDARGAYQALQSNLQTIQRVVTVTFEPLDAAAAAALTPPSAEAPEVDDGAPVGGGGMFRVDVRVDKARQSTPERQVTTSAGALALYSAGTPTRAGELGPRSRVLRWTPLGRDGLLEQFLLDKLAEVPGVTVAAESAPPASDAPAPDAEEPAPIAPPAPPPDVPPSGASAPDLPAGPGAA